MQPIIGHEAILSFFDTVMQRDGLRHAYCFVGPAEIGKQTVARHVAKQLLETTDEKLATHPDFFYLAQELNEKTGKTKQNIDMAQLRDLRSRLRGKPFLGKWKVAVIDDAEKMNTNAANALLKTLEEPAGHTVIFLITTSLDALPATIRSRSQILAFHPMAPDVLSAALQERGTLADHADDVSRLSFGRPGRALTWLSDDELFQAYQHEVVRFEGLLGKSFGEKMQVVDDLFGDKTDHIKQRAYIVSVLALWRVLVRDYMMQLFGRTDMYHTCSNAAGFTANQCTEADERIVRAMQLLSKNIHPRLLVEQVLLALP